MRLLLSLVALAALAPSVTAADTCDDEALALAALELAGEPRIDGRLLRRAMIDAGSDLPHGWARRFADRASARQWRDELEADAPIVCGWAEREDAILVVAAPRAGRLTIDRDVARAEVIDGFGEAHLVVQDGADRVHRLPLEGGRASLEALPHPLVVQLVATGPRGPRPVAERRVGAPLATTVQGSGPLAHRLDALREVHGASPLRPNRLLERAAERHARAICREGAAAHRIGRSDPERRLAGQGIRARVVGEAVARVARREDALEALVVSPGHRAALLDRRFTDVGVGRARARGRTCVVVSLAAWPRYVGH